MRWIKYLLLIKIIAIYPGLLFSKADPFGLLIGSVNSAYVKESIGAKTEIKDLGINHVTEGRVLVSSGLGLGINHLKNVTYFFDTNEILAGLVLELPKSQHNQIFDALLKKYVLFDKQEQRGLDNGISRFRDGNVNIYLILPYQGDDMEVHYCTDEIEEKSRNAGSKSKQEKISVL